MLSMHHLLAGFTLLWLACPLVVLAEKPADFDIITMKNGDIHQGTAAIEFMSIQTSFGKLSIPYHQLLSLKTGNNNKLDQLTTRRGEIIYGQALDVEVTMLRVLDTTLPLAIDDISTITFAPRNIYPSTKQLPDIVKTNTNDQLLVQVINKELLLKNTSSLQSINHQKIRFLDLALDEDDEILQAQVTLADGTLHQGQPTLTHFKLKTYYSDAIELPIKAISEIRYAIAESGKQADFIHRWKKAPASFFQDRMVSGSLAPEMIIIQGGEFMRGDVQGDDDEKPPTAVKLGKFAIGVFEVTFNEYDQFCTDTRREKPDDADWGRGNRPVVNITWEDAKTYTLWLSKKTGEPYRLPSDAEWEFAARAGTTSKYWWGEETGHAKANCEGCNSLWDGVRTAPVGRFPANPLGLHDTAGNVFEWVADCYHDRFADAPADGSPIEKPGCGKRVIRGGAWSFPAKEIRSANRWRDFPSRSSDDTGFRVARDI